MTKFLAALMNALLWGLTIFLPRWKRLTVRARLHDKLQTFEDVKIGDKSLKIFIPDRTCVYCAKEGPDSEPETNNCITSFASSDTFVDIGANIGLYSLLAASHGLSRIYAIEPNPFSFSVLARNIVSNGFDSQIITLCLVMNKKSSIVTFKLGSTHAGSINNEIAVEGFQPESMSITTTSFAVDELFRIQEISSINHLKIDVDGHELEILRGATELLSDKALKSVLVEYNLTNGREKSELTSFIEQFGFRQSGAWAHGRTNNIIFTRKC
jgi:FkbM family methyltransferase